MYRLLTISIPFIICTFYNLNYNIFIICWNFADHLNCGELQSVCGGANSQPILTQPATPVHRPEDLDPWSLLNLVLNLDYWKTSELYRNKNFILKN